MLHIVRTPNGVIVTSDEVEDMRLAVSKETKVLDVLIEAEAYIRNVMKAREAARDS